MQERIPNKKYTAGDQEVASRIYSAGRTSREERRLAESRSRVFFTWGSDGEATPPRHQGSPAEDGNRAEEAPLPPNAAAPKVEKPRTTPKKQKKKKAAAAPRRAWGAAPPPKSTTTTKTRTTTAKKAAAAAEPQKKRPFAMYGRNVDTRGRGNRKTFNVKAASEIKKGALRAGVRAGGISAKRAEKAAHLPSVAVALPAVEPVAPPATDDDFVAPPAPAPLSTAAAAGDVRPLQRRAVPPPPHARPAHVAHVAHSAGALPYPDALSDGQRAELERIVASEIARHVEQWHSIGGGMSAHVNANVDEGPYPAPASSLGYSSGDEESEDKELNDAVHSVALPPPQQQEEEQQVARLPQYEYPRSEWLTEYQANFISPPSEARTPKKRIAGVRHFVAANKPGGPHMLWIPSRSPQLQASARSADGGNGNVGKAWR